MNGVVTERALGPGEFRNDQAHILTVAELDPLRIETFLPIRLLLWLKREEAWVGVVGFASMMVEADMTVAITRTEHTAAELRWLAAGSNDAAVARWLLALALVLDGRKREDAARLAGMDRQALRDWVHRYDVSGIAGLADRHGGSVAPRLSAGQAAEVVGWMQAGPDVAVDKVVR